MHQVFGLLLICVLPVSCSRPFWGDLESRELAGALDNLATGGVHVRLVNDYRLADQLLGCLLHMAVEVFR
jgi:hypothetical protein